MEAVHRWPDGHARPEACVGRAPENPKHYKVFKYRSELQSAGYQPVSGTVLVYGSWAAYDKLRLVPPDPVQTDDEECMHIWTSSMKILAADVSGHKRRLRQGGKVEMKWQPG